MATLMMDAQTANAPTRTLQSDETSSDSGSLSVTQRTSGRDEETGLPILGHMVSWSLRGPVPYQSVSDAFENEFGSLDGEVGRYAPPKIGSSEALKRALESEGVDLIKQIGGRNSGRFSCIIAPPDESGESTRPRVAFDCYVRADPATGHLDVLAQDAALAARLTDKTRLQADQLYGQDISRAFVEHLVPLGRGSAWRQSGGVYFIPRQYNHVVDSMEHIVTALGHGSTFQLMGLYDADRYRGQAAQLLHESLLREVDELRQDADSLKTRDNVRASTMHERLRQYSALMQKMGVYEDLLDVYMQDVRAKVQRLQEDVKSLLGV